MISYLAKLGREAIAHDLRLHIALPEAQTSPLSISNIEAINIFVEYWTLRKPWPSTKSDSFNSIASSKGIARTAIA